MFTTHEYVNLFFHTSKTVNVITVFKENYFKKYEGKVTLRF